MKKSGKSSEKSINIFNKVEIDYWCGELNCEREDLLNAILTAGKTVSKVKAHLGKRKNKRKPNH